MPIVEISWVSGRIDDQKHDVAARVTQTLVEVAGVHPDAVWVVFRDVAPDDWRAGGRAVTLS